MLKKSPPIFVLIIVLIVGGILVGKNSSGKVKMPTLGSNNLTTPTQPPSTPTPIPIIIDSSSNLREEVDKLTPEDFSPDFKVLKEEAQKF